MPSKVKRTLIAMTGAVTLTATLGLSAAPASARVVALNDKFCAVYGDQGLGLDFSGLSPDEAKFSADLSRKAAKTGVPVKLKKDLKKLAKVYDRIVHGEPSNKVVADQQTLITKALTRFGTYFAANCIATPPSA